MEIRHISEEIKSIYRLKDSIMDGDYSFTFSEYIRMLLDIIKERKNY